MAGTCSPAVASVVIVDAAAVVNAVEQVVVKASKRAVAVVEGRKVVEGAWVRPVLAWAFVAGQLELSAYHQDLWRRKWVRDSGEEMQRSSRG